MDVSCKLNLRRTLFSKIPIDIIYWRLCMICLYLYLILFHANIIQKHHFLFPWYQSQIPCCSCSSTFYSSDRQNFPKANTKPHIKKPIDSFPFFSVLNSRWAWSPLTDWLPTTLPLLLLLRTMPALVRLE